MELGNLQGGQEVTFTTEEKGEALTLKVYRFSNRAMIEAYDALNDMPLRLTSWTDSKLSGAFYAEEAGVLFTSIP